MLGNEIGVITQIHKITYKINKQNDIGLGLGLCGKGLQR